MGQPPPPANRPPLPVFEAQPDLQPVYANFVRLAHSPADFVFDFAHLLPGVRQARINARILMSPISAKLLHRALTENIARYEAAFGEINVPGNTSLAEHLFRPYQGPGEAPGPDAPPDPQPPEKK